MEVRDRGNTGIVSADDVEDVQPLMLDKMFERVFAWGIARSGERPAKIHPQGSKTPVGVSNDGDASPVEPMQVDSPLGALFDYPELTPHILKWFERPAELAVLARVNTTFRDIARRKLYYHIWVRPWEANCDTKFVLLFQALQGRPYLCKLVRHLDVRFFPLAMKDPSRYELEDMVNQALRDMINLEHLVWTRDRSLNPELGETVAALTRLKTLEVSGHSVGYYDPHLLATSSSLEDLRVMIPDSQLIGALPLIVRTLADRPRGGLKGLGIIARNTSLVDDTMLRNLSDDLGDLKRLTLWGCNHVTRAGLDSIIRQAEYLEEMSIDASPHSGLHDLSSVPPLNSLLTLSISFSAPHLTPLHPTFLPSDLPILPTLPSLTSLFLTLSSDRALLPPTAIDHLASQISFTPLIRLSILNLYCTSDHLNTILALSPRLEELYVSITSERVLHDAVFGQHGAGAHLRVLHVTGVDTLLPKEEDLRAVAALLPRLEQVGMGNRVYEIHRRLEGDGQETQVVVNLSRWSRIYTPSYFLNWRG